MSKKGETTGYAPMSFDEVYTKKLNAFCAQVRALIYNTVYVAPLERSCPCGCRILVWIGGYNADRCIRCYKIKSRDPEALNELLKEYPDIEECREEWKPPKKTQSCVDTTQAVAFGARIEEARQTRGWSQAQLAERILKKDLTNISVATIRMIEKGHQNCSEHVREQLLEVLELKEGVAQCS